MNKEITRKYITEKKEEAKKKNRQMDRLIYRYQMNPIYFAESF